jgi:hypothetical protein
MQECKIKNYRWPADVLRRVGTRHNTYTASSGIRHDVADSAWSVVSRSTGDVIAIRRELTQLRLPLEADREALIVFAPVTTGLQSASFHPFIIARLYHLTVVMLAVPCVDKAAHAASDGSPVRCQWSAFIFAAAIASMAFLIVAGGSQCLPAPRNEYPDQPPKHCRTPNPEAYR